MLLVLLGHAGRQTRHDTTHTFYAYFSNLFYVPFIVLELRLKKNGSSVHPAPVPPHRNLGSKGSLGHHIGPKLTPQPTERLIRAERNPQVPGSADDPPQTASGGIMPPWPCCCRLRAHTEAEFARNRRGNACSWPLQPSGRRCTCLCPAHFPKLVGACKHGSVWPCDCIHLNPHWPWPPLNLTSRSQADASTSCVNRARHP